MFKRKFKKSYYNDNMLMYFNRDVLQDMKRYRRQRAINQMWDVIVECGAGFTIIVSLISVALIAYIY